MFLILKTTDWIDEGSSPVNSAILIRENDAEWLEPLVEVEVEE